MSMGPGVLHLQNFFLGKHFSAGLSGGGAGENTGGYVFAGSGVALLCRPLRWWR